MHVCGIGKTASQRKRECKKL